MSLTQRSLQVLRLMASAQAEGRHDEAEIVCSGRECWLDVERLSYRTVESLLGCMAISEDDSGGATLRYTVNGTGRAIARRPELADEVAASMIIGRPFTIEADRLVELPEQGRQSTPAP